MRFFIFLSKIKFDQKLTSDFRIGDVGDESDDSLLHLSASRVQFLQQLQFICRLLAGGNFRQHFAQNLKSING